MTNEEAIYILRNTAFLAPSLEPIDEAIEMACEALRKDEPNNSEFPNNCEPKICDTCRYYNSNIPCGSTPSACKEADKFAEEFVDGLKKLKPTISKMEQVDKDINVRSKDEPQKDCKKCKNYDRCKNNRWKCCVYQPKDEPQTYVINPQEPTNDDKCFECVDFFTCGGKCNKIEDEPQTDCTWK